MLKSHLSDYSDACILVKGTVNAAAQDAATINIDKKVISKNCAPFINCISKINNTQVDDSHDIDVAMSIYNLVLFKNIWISW